MDSIIKNLFLKKITKKNVCILIQNLKQNFTKYKDKLKDSPIYEGVACEKLWFGSQTFHLMKTKGQHLTKYVPCLETTKFELLGELFVCCTCIKLVNVNKELQYLVLHNISMNPIISLVLELHELEERLIVPRQMFAQIWQVEGYDQYNI
jgi:hypothetical protein